MLNFVFHDFMTYSEFNDTFTAPVEAGDGIAALNATPCKDAVNCCTFYPAMARALEYMSTGWLLAVPLELYKAAAEEGSMLHYALSLGSTLDPDHFPQILRFAHHF